MLVGHLHPLVVEHVERALHETGTLFVTPSPQATEMSERFCQRFGLDMIRFTNSGTESLMYAIRAARAYTERKAIVKVEGGYHGGYDALQVSVKPALADIGPAAAPIGDVPFDVEAGTVHVVAYNDLPMLERILAQHGSEIAALVIEPVIENLAIVVPDEGYLAGVRALCDQHGVVLIFDEVKTGLTAGPAGAAQRLGVQPDLITLAKSIGGGFPLAAFGGKREVMEVVVDGRMAHFGTYNGNPLVMAAARAVDELCTQEALDGAEAINLRAMNAIAGVISEYELPAHTVGLGVKGCITWSTTPVRNYRDYKATDFDLAFAQWIHGINRGVLLPPGLDEQWLISVMHSESDAMHYADVFAEFVAELVS
jgi:glutamate-1-semialdehyde 2,1-aminomutase